MRIGIPKECKVGEGRVVLTPKDMQKLIAENHLLFIESGAGEKSGFLDAEYESVGATIIKQPQALYQLVDLVVKVKEPQPQEWSLLKPGQSIFCFLHLSANPELVNLLKEKNITALAFEAIEDKNGRRPILCPMSVIAGQLAVQAGMHYLRSENGGLGILIQDAKTTVIGAAGIAGKTALGLLNIFLGTGKINAVDLNKKRLKELRKYGRFEIIDDIEKAVAESDLLILAAVKPGWGAPKIITRKMIASMKKGSVLVDISIDEGGCSETSRPTTLADPVYIEDGAIHYCVPNIPGSVPRSSSLALSAAVNPYLLRLAKCFDEQLWINDELLQESNKGILKALQVYQGELTNQAAI